MKTPAKRRERLEKRLRRGCEARQAFVRSRINMTISLQVRVMRECAGWSQAELARRCGTSQNAISRIESPGYGHYSVTTLKKIAAVFDVALVVRFAPFSELVDWAINMNTESILVPSFDQRRDEETRSGVVQ